MIDEMANAIVALNNSKPRLPTREEIVAALMEEVWAMIRGRNRIDPVTELEHLRDMVAVAQELLEGAGGHDHTRA